MSDASSSESEQGDNEPNNPDSSDFFTVKSLKQT